MPPPYQPKRTSGAWARCQGDTAHRIGAVERSRTSDLLITNQLLYQLSYNSLAKENSDYRGLKNYRQTSYASATQRGENGIVLFRDCSQPWIDYGLTEKQPRALLMPSPG